MAGGDPRGRALVYPKRGSFVRAADGPGQIVAPFCCALRDDASLRRSTRCRRTGMGLREFAHAADTRLMLYLKEETNMGANLMAGLDTVAQVRRRRHLHRHQVCGGPRRPVAGSVSRPAAEAGRAAQSDQRHRRTAGDQPSSPMGLARIHHRFRLPCPRIERGCLSACRAGDYAEAERIRSRFLDLEDIRDAWGPARVLHHALELAGIACHRAYSTLRFRTFSGTEESSSTCVRGTPDAAARA